jgi:hypothetical protein
LLQGVLAVIESFLLCHQAMSMLAVCRQVCMVLRFVAEEVMVYADDLGQASKRALLAGQQAGLPVVLPTLTQLLERHYGAALSAAQASQPAQAQSHAAAVTAGLGAQQKTVSWHPNLHMIRHMSGGVQLKACPSMFADQAFLNVI